MSPETWRQNPEQLPAAYATCRSIVRARAKNFYYAFLALPRAKRNALSAVYAFMRHADDLSDEPGLRTDERRARMGDWLESGRKAFSGTATDDAVLYALADTQRRYRIPAELFEQLVAGTAMDLDVEESAQANPDQPAALCATFDDLYRYCYYVASVVGLVCIRIFGYRNPEAEPLAVKCGVAFQLTNIIRDVREDAELGRIYLPQEDLERFGCSPFELAPQNLKNGFEAGRFRPLLEFETRRAREFYKAAEKLVPMVDADSRGALWALVEIYRRLLEKIAACDYNIFEKRVRLSAAEKLTVLSRGLARRFTA